MVDDRVALAVPILDALVVDGHQSLRHRVREPRSPAVAAVTVVSQRPTSPALPRKRVRSTLSIVTHGRYAPTPPELTSR
jgi:hypothetical protein